jgi:SAM-dependent MidA family methyltransferase
MPFARFMEMLLYTPGLGYYAAGARKFGAAGDFVTAPEMSGLVGQALAMQIAQALRSGFERSGARR